MTRTEEVYSGYSRSPRKQRAWDAANPGNAAIRAELLAAIVRAADGELRGGGLILEIGCGTGWGLRGLAQAGVDPERLVGIDLQAARVDAARSSVPGALIAIGDARWLDFADDTFDLVFLLTLLSSLPSAAAIRTALVEARRVLAPGGLLLAYEPRVPNPFNRNTRLLRNADLRAAGIEPADSASLTLLPALARRLGTEERAADRYQRLSRLPLLRTHRLIAYRADD